MGLMATIPAIWGRLLGVVIVLLLIWGLIRLFEWRNLYYPSSDITSTPEQFGLEYEDVYFFAEDGKKLHGWWVPHTNARGTIIYCHGNAGNIGGRAWLTAELQKLNVNVFLFDYRGYGNSQGIPTEQGTYRDARAAYEVVRAKYDDVDDPPIIAFGRSLGGAVAIQMAVDKPVRAVITECTFSSTYDMAQHLYPMLPIGIVCAFKYDSASKVPDLTMPKLFAHGLHDELIPFELGQKLYEAAGEPKRFFELHGGHNEAGWQTTPDYWHAIEELVTRVFGPRTE